MIIPIIIIIIIMIINDTIILNSSTSSSIVNIIDANIVTGINIGVIGMRSFITTIIVITAHTGSNSYDVDGMNAEECCFPMANVFFLIVRTSIQ